jgi:competence protein ComGF
MSAQKYFCKRFKAKNSQGFILLEVLVAMSMILGVWMVSVGVYQGLALNLMQQESKRSQLRKELDVFEMQEQVRANLVLSSQGLSNDIARVSDRNRSMRTTTQSAVKDKR